MPDRPLSIDEVTLLVRRGALQHVEKKDDKVFVRTIPCAVCGTIHKYELDRKQYEAWQNDTYIQHAFPALSADDREILLSGICPECWEILWSEPEGD